MRKAAIYGCPLFVSYRGDNRQIRVAYPNDAETIYTYDGANRPKSVINQKISTQGLISELLRDTHA